ncbi:MAG TPA: hypothetical protein VLD38_07885 [Nitrosopumilaceae archaeon]|nr:hypothetical protein [Nitrosopumilaceae archaeon]
MYIVEKEFVESSETKTCDLTKINIQKIENLIFEKYHFSLIECSKNTYKLDSILRKIFGPSHLLLERAILENAVDLAISKDMQKEWLLLQSKSLILTILNTFGDRDKNKILAISADKPHIIAKIVELSGVQENLAYKKIHQLIRDGMLIEYGSIFTPDARELKKYVGVFKDLKCGILNNKIAIKIMLSKAALNVSQIILLLQSLTNKTIDKQ